MEGRNLEIQAHRDDEQPAVVAAVGEVDLGNAGQLRTELLDALVGGIVILDAAGITFCDSSGVRVLAEADRVARAAGLALRVAVPSQALTRALAPTGFLAVLRLYPDTETALRG